MSLDIVGPGALIHVTERDDVARSRRAAHELAIAVGVDGRRMSELALVVTVVATNLVLHGGGRLSLRRLGTLGGPGLEILAYLDADPRPWQPRSSHPEEAFGAGLSAVRRLSDDYAVALGTDGGPILWARVGPTLRHTRRGRDAGAKADVAPQATPYVTGLVAAPQPGGEDRTRWEAVHRSGRVTVVACQADGTGADDQARTLVSLAVRASGGARLPAYREILGAAAGAGAAVVELDLHRRTVTAAVTGSLTVRITADGRLTEIAPSTPAPQEVRIRWAHTAEAIIHSASVRARFGEARGADGHGALPRHPALRAAALIRESATDAVDADRTGLVVVAQVDTDVEAWAAQG